MTVDLRAAAGDYLQARRARGHRLARHEGLISAFLDGLAAQNATTITRDNAVAFATAPARTGRAWQAFRLSAIRGFAAYVHGLDPDAAQLIPDRLLPATYARRIPYLYSPAQISDLLTTSTAPHPDVRVLDAHTGDSRWRPRRAAGRRGDDSDSARAPCGPSGRC